MNLPTVQVLFLSVLANSLLSVSALVASPTPTISSSRGGPLFVTPKLTRLPSGISPFEKSAARSRDFQGEFRKICQRVVPDALQDNIKTLEVEFPPLLGGEKSKTQFDDFDNVQELNQNQDWCVQFAPMLSGSVQPIWLIFPDLKECQLAKEKWTGQLFRQTSIFTSLQQVTQHYTSKAKDQTTYSKPWGATFASGMNQLLGGGGDAGLLGDASALDPLQESAPPKLHLVCQPGNGGPVEDWVNVETLHRAAGGQVPTLIVNGALDKVRDGYYAPFIFPKLAAATPFYRSFQSVFYLKPISDKGVYGWVYRVYPEPWQVILQTPTKDRNGNTRVEDTLALTSDTKPTYDQAIKALLTTAASITTR